MELTVDRLEFHRDKEPQKFVIINNLPQAGLTIEKAFTSWINHSADISPENFCKFIRSKDPNIICLTEDEYYEWAAAK